MIKIHEYKKIADELTSLRVEIVPDGGQDTLLIPGGATGVEGGSGLVIARHG